MEIVISIFLTVLGAYFVIGIGVALYFVLLGASRMDPLMGDSKKFVRILLFPGVLATWPFLIRKLFKTSRK